MGLFKKKKKDKTKKGEAGDRNSFTTGSLSLSVSDLDESSSRNRSASLKTPTTGSAPVSPRESTSQPSSSTGSPSTSSPAKATNAEQQQQSPQKVAAVQAEKAKPTAPPSSNATTGGLINTKTAPNAHESLASRARRRNYSFYNANEFKELAQQKKGIKEEEIKHDNSPQVFKDLFPAQVYNAFHELKNLSRDLNTQLPVPEFVLVGKRGQGKSALLEALLGYTINYVCEMPEVAVKYGATKRPIYYHLVNNPSIANLPKVTLRYSNAAKKGSAEKSKPEEGTFVERIVPIEKVGEEVEWIAKIDGDALHVSLEHQYFLDVTFIDTPGVVLGDVPEDDLIGEDVVRIEEPETPKLDPAVINARVHELIFPPHRNIIAVEEAAQWSDIGILNFVKQVDPVFTRVTLVLTHFSSLLRSFQTSQEVNRYFNLSPISSNLFFSSLFSSKVRSKFCATSEEFTQNILKSYRRDKRTLESLSFDVRYRKHIGIGQMRLHVMSSVLKSYQANIPELLNRIRSNLRQTEHKLQSLQKHPLYTAELSGLEEQYKTLRAIASSYITQFLKITQNLVSGTIEGLPHELGETSAEEIEHSEAGPWVDDNYAELKPNPEAVAFYNQKIYGGQQFKRLLAEFRTLCKNIELDELTMEDIVLNSGSSLSGSLSLSTIIWAACEVTQQKASSLFKPLVSQLVRRAVYILKRLPTIIQRVMKNRQADQVMWRGTKNDEMQNFERYPYFTAKVKQDLEEFVDKAAKEVVTKCDDEFVDTRSMYWSALFDPNIKEGVDQHALETNTQPTIKTISKRVFDTVRDRIVDNVILKLFNFLLMPMKDRLWSDIHGKISAVENQELTQMFELNAVVRGITVEQSRLRQVFNTSMEQESTFLRNSQIFNQLLEDKKKKLDKSSVALDRIRDRRFKYNLHGLGGEAWAPEGRKKALSSTKAPRVTFQEPQAEAAVAPQTSPRGAGESTLQKYTDMPRRMIRFEEPITRAVKERKGEEAEDYETSSDDGEEDDSEEEEKPAQSVKKPETAAQEAKQPTEIAVEPKSEEVSQQVQPSPVVVPQVSAPVQTEKVVVTEPAPRPAPVQATQPPAEQKVRAPSSMTEESPINASLYPDSDDEEDDDDDEEYFNDALEEIIERINDDDETLDTVDLETVNDKLSVVGEGQILDFAGALAKSTTVERLILRNKGVNNSVINTLAVYLKRNSTLRELDLSDNKLDDGSAKALSLLLSSSSIETLNLEGTHITAAGYATILQGATDSKTITSVKLGKLATEENKSAVAQIVARNKK